MFVFKQLDMHAAYILIEMKKAWKYELIDNQKINVTTFKYHIEKILQTKNHEIINSFENQKFSDIFKNTIPRKILF